MTFRTYSNKEEKERQDREDVLYEESKRECVDEDTISCYPYYGITETLGKIGLGLIAFTICAVPIREYFRDSPPLSKGEIEKTKIENVIKSEYNNKISKLDSAYKIELKDVQSAYQNKRDSLKKVYKSKLEEAVK